MSKRQVRHTIQAKPAALSAKDAAATFGTWPQVDAEFLRELSPIMRGVVKALGYARAKVLLEMQGGTRVYLTASNAQSLNLTTEEMARLREALKLHLPEDGDDRLMLPMPTKAITYWRNENVRRDLHSMTVRQVVHKYKLCDRWVRALNSEVDKHSRANSVDVQTGKKQGKPPEKEQLFLI